MKINDIQSISEAVSSEFKVLSPAERIAAKASRQDALRQAAGRPATGGGGGGPPSGPNNPYKFTYDNAPKTNRAGEAPGAAGKKPDAKQAEPNDAPKGGTGPEGSRVPPQVQAQMDKAADVEKSAKSAKAADDALPKRGMFQSKQDYANSLTKKQQKAYIRAQQIEKEMPNNALDKIKANPVKTGLATAAVVGTGVALNNKAQDVAKKDAALDANAPAAAPAAPAAPNDDGTINNPSKNSPYAVPADNDTRQSKPYPGAPADNDSRQSKPYPEVTRPAGGASTSTGYKGSQGSQAIQALNPEIADVNKIRTGQQLKMPDGSTYTVQKGDALDRIARNAGVKPPAAKPADAPVAAAPADAPAAAEPVAPSKVYTGEPASVDTRDGTGDNDKPAAPTRDYSSGRPVDKELDDKYGTSNTRTDAEGRTYVRQKSAMGGPDTENRSYASFGDFFNKIRGKGDVNGKVADEVQENYELNSIKKLSSITESKITQVDKNMDLRKLLAIMSETKMADLKGKKHGGSYGKEYDTDEEGDDSKPAEKKSRGGQESDSTKDSKKWQGADDAADAIIGGKAPKKEVGKKSVKHSIKEWMQTVEESLLEDEEKSFVCVHAKKGKCEVKAKTSYEAAKKAADKWKMKSTAGIDTHRADKPIHVDEAKDKKAKKDYDKDGKIETGAEEHAGSVDNAIKKNMKKKQVKEGVNLHKMMTEKQVKVDEMLEELQKEIAEFKATGEMGDKLRDALDLHTYTKGETLIGEGDNELADKWHDEDMARLGDEGKADAQHMKDLDRSHDESTADLWRMKDLARDSTMGRADAISLREEDHAQGDTVYHRGQIGIVDRIEGNKCFVHKPNGDMDVWPTEECSKKKQGHFDVFKKDVQDVGAGFGRFLKGKSELDESPFAFEDAEPRLRTTKTDTGTETTSSTGRIKATFEPGKETTVEPVKEMGPSPLDKTSSSIGSKARPSDAATTAPRERERVVSPKIDKYEKDQAAADQARRSIVDRESPKANNFGRTVGKAISEPIAAIKSAWHGATDAWDHEMGNDTAPDPKAPVSVMSRSSADKAGIKESMVYDVWNHQLEKMINESLTVTTTKGDNGTDDSVSVTASGNDASEIMAILRNAGIGSMGNEKEHIDHPTSAYGAPEGESVGIVKIDGPEVIDGDDTMLGLMKKIADISNGNSDHRGHGSSDDYADENCEQEVEEGNAFTGALKKTPQGGKFEVDGHEYTDHSSLEEGHGMCSECGTNMYETDCGHRQMVDEDDVEDAKVGIAAGSPAAQAAEPSAPEAGQRPGGVAFNQDAPAAPAAAGPAASNAAMSALTGGASAPSQTAAMPTSQSTAASAPAAPTSNIRSRTPDEIANTGPMGIQKPSAADKAAGDRTLNSIKNFFGGGKPDQAAQDKAGSAVGAGYAQAQAATDKNVQAQNTDVAATAARDQLQKDVNAGKSVASTNVAPSQINPAVLGQQAGATTKATGKVSYAPNAGGVTKTASANPAQKLAAQNKAGSKIGQGYAQAALAETDDESAEVGLEEAEYANSDDDAALQDIKFMTNYITGGLNGQKTMHRHGYQNADNPLAMRESADPLAQWKKLSGLS
jgi:LysM repeat protein